MPATASARSELHGQTGQGKPVVLGVNDFGRIDRAEVGWTAACRRSRATVETAIGLPLEIYEASRDLVATAARDRVRQGRLRMVVRVRLRGARDVAARRWAGTFSIKVAVRRGRRLVDRCATPQTAWSVPLGDTGPQAPSVHDTGGGAASSPPTYQPAPSASAPPPEPDENPEVESWSLRMEGERGDYVSGGRAWSHGSPGEELTVTASRRYVGLHVNTEEGWWSGDFAAPPDQDLEARRYPDARRYPFHDGHPGFWISGNGRGCNESFGEFTVQELVYTADGTLKRFKVTFDHRCESASAPALRGTWEVTTTA